MTRKQRPTQDTQQGDPGSAAGTDAQPLDIWLNEAVGHHHAGRLAEAEEIYRRILAADPKHPQALCLLGAIAHAAGENEQAVDLMTRAIAAKPDYADAHGNLGAVLLAGERNEEALASFDKALALDPNHTEALNNKGAALKASGRNDDAIACYRKAIEIRPDYAEAHYNLGNILREMKHMDDALASFRKAIEFRPGYAEAHNNLGNLYRDMDRMEDAVAVYKTIIALNPDFAEAWHNLGLTLQALGRLDEAVDGYHKALAINPDFGEAWHNLGLTHQALGRLDDAIGSFRKALALNPDSVEALSNLGSVLKDLGRLDEAAASYRKALAADPDLAEVHYNLGLVHLLTGDFDNGWREYGWRWRMRDFSSRRADNDKPLWDGGGLGGKTIFLYPEQGLGDAIQFSRYASMVAARGGKVVLEGPASLEGLLRDIDGVDAFVVSGDPPPPFDCHAPLLDLPGLLKTTLETIPSHGSYLKAAPGLNEKWADRLGPWEDFRVGIAWAGNPVHRNDRNRSMDPALLWPLTEIPGVSVYSLQFGKEGEASKIFGDRVTDLGPDLTPFTEAAAAINNLDLVVSVDSSSAHLAGALGRPVWVLLPFMPDWRWLLKRDDSPWYPSMRLFRQDSPGDWNGVMERVRAALGEESGSERN